MKTRIYETKISKETFVNNLSNWSNNYKALQENNNIKINYFSYKVSKSFNLVFSDEKTFKLESKFFAMFSLIGLLMCLTAAIALFIVGIASEIKFMYGSLVLIAIAMPTLTVILIEDKKIWNKLEKHLIEKLYCKIINKNNN